MWREASHSESCINIGKPPGQALESFSVANSHLYSQTYLNSILFCCLVILYVKKPILISDGRKQREPNNIHRRIIGCALPRRQILIRSKQREHRISPFRCWLIGLTHKPRLQSISCSIFTRLVDGMKLCRQSSSVCSEVDWCLSCLSIRTFCKQQIKCASPPIESVNLWQPYPCLVLRQASWSMQLKECSKELLAKGIFLLILRWSIQQ